MTAHVSKLERAAHLWGAAALCSGEAARAQQAAADSIALDERGACPFDV